MDPAVSFYVLGCGDTYEIAEDVRFIVKESGEIQKVAMDDAPKGNTSKKSTGGSIGGSSGSTSKGGGSTQTSSPRRYSNPQTGDTTNIILWVVLLGLAAVMVGAFLYAGRQEDKKDKQEKK